MSPRDLAARFGDAIFGLACATPHLSPRARFTRELWPTYCQGYYWGLVTAARVVENTAATIEQRAASITDARRAEIARYFWRVMRWERVRGVEHRVRGAA